MYNTYSNTYDTYYTMYNSEEAITYRTARLENARYGRVGLGNLGNTCYMNTALQCLSHLPALTMLFLSEEYKNDINKENKSGSKGRICDAYYELLAKLWLGCNEYYSPRSFKGEIDIYAKLFEGYQQHDSQEFFIMLLDLLHEDMNYITNKPYIELPIYSSFEPSQVSEMWNYHLARNSSRIIDLFYGQTVNFLKCSICGEQRTKYEPFSCITLPLPREKKKLYVNIMPSRLSRFHVVEEQRGSRLPELVTVIVNESGLMDEVIAEVANQCNVLYEQVYLVYDSSLRHIDEKRSQREWLVSKHTLYAYILPDASTVHHCFYLYPSFNVIQSIDPRLYKKCYFSNYPFCITYSSQSTNVDILNEIESLLKEYLGDLQGYSDRLKAWKEMKKEMSQLGSAAYRRSYERNSPMHTHSFSPFQSSYSFSSQKDDSFHKNMIDSVIASTKQVSDNAGGYASLFSEAPSYHVSNIAPKGSEPYYQENESFSCGTVQENNGGLKGGCRFGCCCCGGDREDSEPLSFSYDKLDFSSGLQETENAPEDGTVSSHASEDEVTSSNAVGANGYAAIPTAPSVEAEPTSITVILASEDDEQAKDEKNSHVSNEEQPPSLSLVETESVSVHPEEEMITSKLVDKRLAWYSTSPHFPVYCKNRRKVSIPYTSALFYDWERTEGEKSVYVDLFGYEDKELLQYYEKLKNGEKDIEYRLPAYKDQGYTSFNDYCLNDKALNDFVEDVALKALLNIGRKSGKEKSVGETTSWYYDERDEEKETFSLDQCWELFLKKGNLDENNKWFCPHCKDHVCAEKTTRICKLPPVLVLQLERFEYNAYTYGNRNKIYTTIVFPIQNVDMKSYVEEKSEEYEEDCVYDLTAICNHSGNAGGGHYYCYACDENDGEKRWFEYNDSSVRECQEDRLVTPEAYVLFYERRKSHMKSSDIKERIKKMRVEYLEHIVPVKEAADNQAENMSSNEKADKAASHAISGDRWEEPSKIRSIQSNSIDAIQSATQEAVTQEEKQSSSLVSGEKSISVSDEDNLYV